MMRSSAFLLAGLLLATPAHAVIVAGANGGGDTTNNTTEAQLESTLGFDFGHYDSVVRYGTGSGVYLGHSPDRNSVFVLSAQHVFDDNGAINIGGGSYNFVSRTNIAGADLEVLEYTGGGLVPSISPAELASAAPSAGQPVLMIGYGQNRLENAATNPLFSDATSYASGESGYTWSGTRIKRWGFNNVEVFPGESGTLGNFTVGSIATRGFLTTFSSPASGQWTSSNEAIGSLGDSGGGVFGLENGEWKLMGTFSAASQADLNNDGVINANDSASPFFQVNANNEATGLTLMTDTSTFSDEILAITGPLVTSTAIPEPSSSALLLSFALAALTRRRR